MALFKHIFRNIRKVYENGTEDVFEANLFKVAGD